MTYGVHKIFRLRVNWDRFMVEMDKYTHLPKQDLIARIERLETALKASEKKLAKLSKNNINTLSSSKERSSQKAFNFSAYPSRKIALKFTYDGSHYNGLEYTKMPTPLPTVEEVLWGALAHLRLVNPEEGFEGVGWEKCGRTDKGVSAAGQVVSFRIRSALKGRGAPKPNPSFSDAPTATSVDESPQPVKEDSGDNDDGLFGLEGDFGGLSSWDEPPSNTVLPSNPNLRDSNDDNDELNYVTHLNGVLPPTIRVLAWSPVSEEFSSRFNCRSRHYKYFFLGRGLDIDAMREGASRLIGEHDFRNLHKLDPAKQLTHFKRRILRAEINETRSHAPQDDRMYVLDLVGTAFLYNQVRHIMAILFLIGTRLEKPSLVTALLNTDPENPYPPFRPDEPTPVVVTTKPIYQMADPLPLVLWDCTYTDSDVSWRTDRTDDNGASLSAEGAGKNLYGELRATHERSLVHAALHEHFTKAAGVYHPPPAEYIPLQPAETLPEKALLSIPLGGATVIHTTKYIPVLERKRLDDVVVSNERWRMSKGARRAERKAGEVEACGEE